MKSDVYKGFFAGKKVTLMGLGLLGRGIGDAAFLAECSAELTVTDLKTEEQLASSLEKLAHYPDITYVLGEHRLEDFRQADMVIKAAGVPADSSYISEAHKHSVPVYMTTALFAKFVQETGAIVIGVTGTRGKSTTAHLIAHALKSVGRRVHLGGNIRGLSTLALLPEVEAEDFVVLELDSWQLQGFGDLKISPHVSVFTNLMADHLNYYKGDMEAYFWDKANIFINQKSGDKLVVGPSIYPKIEAAAPLVSPTVPPPLPGSWKLRIIGEHNKENAALAAGALRPLGLSEDEIRAGLESFSPVEGRLQYVADIDGVQIYNDNNATTPEATIAALASFPGQNITLIAGGADKALPLEILAQEIKKSAAAVILLPGAGTDRLKPLLKNFVEASTMQEAVSKAFAAAQGGVILLSPAFASFGLFKNEYDRNDQFLAAIKTHQK